MSEKRAEEVSLSDIHALVDRKDEKMREELYRANTKINTLERRLAQMERRLLCKGSEKSDSADSKTEGGDAKSHRIGWDMFKLTATGLESHVRVSNNGTTVANTSGGGRVVTVWGEPTWTTGKHSFRIRLDQGCNVFVGVLPAVKDDIERLSSSFVGEVSGVGLHSTTGGVYLGGKEYCLGDYAKAEQGDDVGVNVDVDKGTLQFFKNGVPLCRPFVLPKLAGGISPAVTLANRGDKVTIFFTHPTQDE